ncbi:alpha-protein kinase 3 [Xyrauchen texanus]|uniref:alpha-protein kinase 3 n=1 Tax=Xyrauchen texanus TaxID=154827 RepID=UPI002241C36D|nr:alpha-protein kinase 3 [Xyrauchen texanus]
MSSRRLMNRSLSGDGRSYYSGNDITSQNSRVGSRSYLNSVRPESRSTLYSVMARLTEETPPTFESTLKSKAVSEASNIKFCCAVSGYPAPEVTWYKDDVELDRYCGLPKYDISRDGKNHTLHIYDCTLEDAAIYQASAQNSRGIVSCSGVLEVGTMSEYKIHQNYFAKLKQRNDNRCREQEEYHKTDKENVPAALETFKMRSPERAQRKRRSPMFTSLSLGAASSSDEKEGVNTLSQTPPVEDRLGSSVHESAAAPVHGISIIEMIQNRDKDSQGLKYIHKTVHKASSKQTQKENYAKKKIKISTAEAERNKESRQTGKGEVTDIEMRTEISNSIEKMELQKTFIQVASETELRNKVDATKKSEKLSVKTKESPSESKRAQIAPKLNANQKQPALNISMATQNVVVGDIKQTESSDQKKSLGTPHPEHHVNQALDNRQHVSKQRAENCNPTPINNELMDLNDNENKPPVGTSTCVRILPHSCGGGDVNADTGERNASAHSDRASSVGDTHIEPIEPPNCVDLHPFQRAMELNHQPSLVHEVTACVKETDTIFRSCHLASQRQKEREGNQSMGSTKCSTLPVTRHNQSDLKKTLGEEISSGHVSHTLQEGRVATAMNSSLGEDKLTKMSEKHHKAGNQQIKEDFEESKAKTQPVVISLNTMEDNQMEISADKNIELVCAKTHVPKDGIFKEKSNPNSKHSIPQVTVTEFVQICNLRSMSNSDEAVNDSSVADVPVKVTNECQSSAATIPKMDIQEHGQSNLTPSEALKATYRERKSYPAKKENGHCISSSLDTSIVEEKDYDNNPKAEHVGLCTFLSQHTKALPTEFIIPAIYITDVDSTSQNSTNTDSIINKSPVTKSETVQISTKTKTVTSYVTNSNKIGNTFNQSDHMNETIATCESEGLPEEQGHLSCYSKTSDVNKTDQLPHSQENDIQQPKNQSATENDANRPIVEGVLQCNGEKSKKTNELGLVEIKCLPLLAKPDLNLKPESDSFIKQLKCAVLDLEESNLCPTSAMLNPAPHGNSKGEVKDGKVNSAVIQLGMGEFVLPQTNSSLNTVVSPLSPSYEATIPLNTTDNQVFSSTTTYSNLATSVHQKTMFPRTKKGKSEVGMATCTEEAKKDTNQEDKLSLNAQLVSLQLSISNSPFETSLKKVSPSLTQRGFKVDLSKPAGNENDKTKSIEKDKEKQFKVPQVIRKIRPEVFDATGHLKLWCQFFNILNDSSIMWYKDEVEIAEIKRSAGDETQVCLAIVQMSKRDCGIYRCTINNEYGKDSTEYHLSAEILPNMFLREELLEAGEEIEMTPLIFSKGLTDAGCWGSKFFGRVTTEEAQVGMGCEHKTKRLKVIYGLDPVFESGSSCFMKVRSPIAYESREESVLAERNLQITKQDCKIQNMAREYFKIFTAETRMIESFGPALEVIPLYFLYRPANTVPYATVEAELKGVYLRYCRLDHTGSLVFNNKSEVTQKCSSLQHWVYQWTNGNVLFSRLEGVDTLLTNIGIATKSKGYQGFPCEANPKVFELFHTQHQCNYFCGLLNLKPLYAPETLQTPTRSRGSSSPLQQRRTVSSSSSPQTQRKATKSPKVSRC